MTLSDAAGLWLLRLVGEPDGRACTMVRHRDRRDGTLLVEIESSRLRAMLVRSGAAAIVTRSQAHAWSGFNSRMSSKQG